MQAGDPLNQQSHIRDIFPTSWMYGVQCYSSTLQKERLSSFILSTAYKDLGGSFRLAEQSIVTPTVDALDKAICPSFSCRPICQSCA